MTQSVSPGVVAPFDRAEFAIRPAEERDRAPLEAIAAQVWDGHDYLPHVFDEWLHDPAGLFCVGVLREQVVAAAKLTRMGHDQWWMEGLRVDPAFRRLGIARIMHHYIVNYTRQFAPGTLRFSTASENKTVIRFAAETAFVQAAEFVAYGAQADSTVSPDGLRLLGPGDLDRAWDALLRLPRFEATQRSLEDNWRFFPLTSDFLSQRIKSGQVFGWSQADDTGLTGIVIFNEPRGSKAGESDESRLYVGYADARPEVLGAMLAALRGLAAQQGHPRVSWKALTDQGLLSALEEARYERRWDMEILLFSRKLSLIPHASASTVDDAGSALGG